MIGQRDSELICRIIQSQETLLEFFSFATIPLKIVNKLYSRNVKALSDDARQGGETRKEQKSGATGEFHFISLGKNAGVKLSRIGLAERIEQKILTRSFSPVLNPVFFIDECQDDCFFHFIRNIIFLPRGSTKGEDVALASNNIGKVCPSH